MRQTSIFSPFLSSVRNLPSRSKEEDITFNWITSVVTIVLIGLIGSLFYIWSRIQIVNVGYEISREISSKQKLFEEQKKLNLELATLQSPSRLEVLAKKEGMTVPQPFQILNSGKVEKKIVLADKNSEIPLIKTVQNPAKEKADLKKPSVASKSLQKVAVKDKKKTSVTLKKEGSEKSIALKKTASEKKPSLLTSKKPEAKAVKAKSVPSKQIVSNSLSLKNSRR